MQNGQRLFRYTFSITWEHSSNDCTYFFDIAYRCESNGYQRVNATLRHVVSDIKDAVVIYRKELHALNSEVTIIKFMSLSLYSRVF